MPDPRAPRDQSRERDRAAKPRNVVDETSEESFPASDAPAWAPPTRVGAPPSDTPDEKPEPDRPAEREGDDPRP